MRLPRWSQWAVLVLVGVGLLFAGACAPGNNSPQITSLSADPTTVSPEGNSTITCVASDPDGDTLTYSWSYSGPSIGSIVGTGNTVNWTVPDTEGTYAVSVTVADGKGGTDEASCSVTVEVLVTAGSINVKSSPEGATVYVDGTDTGNITPYVITDIDEGDHAIKLSKEFCKDREETVTVAAGETTYVNWELDPAPPQTVTFQPDDIEGKDAWVIDVNPGDNFGDVGVLEVGNDGGLKSRTYIRFNMLPDIPVTAVMTNAELGLWYLYTTSPAVTTINAYKVTGAWAENTITWDEQPAHSPTVHASTSLPDVEANDFVFWQLEAELVEGWIDGTVPNHGVVLIDADEDTMGSLKGFWSSEGGPPNMEPKLTITYYDPAP